MLKSRILQPEEYKSFLAFNDKNSGAPVPLDYVQNDIIRIRVFFYDDPDQWVAAYAINTKAPFRYLSVLTEAQSSELLREHGMSEENLVEITLLSRNPELPWQHRRDREIYYGMSLLDALLTGRYHILGGTVEEKLVDAQMEVLDRIFYQGKFNFFGHPSSGWLYYASRYGAVQNAVYRLIRKPLNLPERPNLRGKKPQPATPDDVPNN